MLNHFKVVTMTRRNYPQTIKPQRYKVNRQEIRLRREKCSKRNFSRQKSNNHHSHIINNYTDTRVESDKRTKESILNRKYPTRYEELLSMG